MGVNKILLVGTVGRAPKIKQADKTKIASFTLATKKKIRRDDGEWEERPTWHNVRTWGPNADYVEHNVRTGNVIFVEGEMSNIEYVDKNGVKRNFYAVLATEILVIVGGPKYTNTQQVGNDIVQNDAFDDLPM